jgi:hypothetical protein
MAISSGIFASCMTIPSSKLDLEKDFWIIGIEYLGERMRVQGTHKSLMMKTGNA